MTVMGELVPTRFTIASSLKMITMNLLSRERPTAPHFFVETKRPGALAGLNKPDVQIVVGVRRGDSLVAREESHREDVARCTCESLDELARVEIGCRWEARKSGQAAACVARSPRPVTIATWSSSAGG